MFSLIAWKEVPQKCHWSHALNNDNKLQYVDVTLGEWITVMTDLFPDNHRIFIHESIHQVSTPKIPAETLHWDDNLRNPPSAQATVHGFSQQTMFTVTVLLKYFFSLCQWHILLVLIIIKLRQLWVTGTISTWQRWVKTSFQYYFLWYASPALIQSMVNCAISLFF